MAHVLRTPLGSLLTQVGLTQCAVVLVQKLDRGHDRFIEEFICAFQIAVLSEELVIIHAAYGLIAYSVGMFLTGILCIMSENRGMPSNPVSTVHFHTRENRLSEIAKMVVSISSQIFAAVVGGRYVMWMWSTELLNSEMTKEYTSKICQSELQVPMMIGLLVEAVTTFICRIVQHRNERHMGGVVSVALTGTLCHLAARPLTGGYGNPSLAFSASYSCSGHDTYEFFSVYFAGPILAGYLVGQYGDDIWWYCTGHDVHRRPLVDHRGEPSYYTRPSPRVISRHAQPSHHSHHTHHIHHHHHHPH